jgi:hypothetical protein
MYSDLSNPTFSTKYGYGNLANNRVDLRPTQKRILIDGTTSTNGNYYHVATWAAAKAVYASGDWILFEGGATSTQTMTLTSMTGGTSAQNMMVVGTFDPADAENDAKFNTLKHTIDWSAEAADSTPFQAFTAISYVAIVNIKFVSDANSQAANMGWLARNTNYIIFENCTFDGIAIAFNNYLIGQITSITSVGTTATVMLPVANANLANGDTVAIRGCTGGTAANYNINASITVTDSTHFTYTIADAGDVAASGSPTYYAAATKYADAELMSDITFRYCGLMYGSDEINERSGHFFAQGIQRLYFEGCIDFHGGWARGVTRATAGITGGVGPDIYKHGLYISDNSDDVRLFDTITAWDSSNPKLTGGNYQLQNYVNIRSPMAFIYDANTSNTYNMAWPSGSVFKCDNMLQVHTDDLNTADAAYRGWAPNIYQAASGSYFKNGLLVNNDSPNSSNRQGMVIGANGTTTATAVTIDETVWLNWNYQSTNTTPDAYTTITFTNNVWDNATSGSNSILTDMSAAYQARAADTEALTVHTTLRQAFPDWFSGVSVGGTNLETEANLLEFICNNPFPGDVHEDSTVRSWATLFQYHWRAALNG